jgi:uncharacterized alkaline shock family protein YloU
VTTEIAVRTSPPEPLTTLPETRGRTAISELVVQKIAAQVVSDAENAGGAARRMFGVSLGSDSEDTEAQVTARVDGAIATVEVAMSVAYPQPVRAVTRRVRASIISTLEYQTGLDVRHVDIAITSMLNGGGGRRVQ